VTVDKITGELALGGGKGSELPVYADEFVVPGRSAHGVTRTFEWRPTADHRRSYRLDSTAAHLRQVSARVRVYCHAVDGNRFVVDQSLLLHLHVDGRPAATV
jgi:hypothetical protein